MMRPVRRGDRRQALLRLAHGRAGEAQRASDLQDKGAQLVIVRTPRRVVGR
jgi:hypothetical protein